MGSRGGGFGEKRRRPEAPDELDCGDKSERQLEDGEGDGDAESRPAGILPDAEGRGVLSGAYAAAGELRDGGDKSEVVTHSTAGDLETTGHVAVDNER